VRCFFAQKEAEQLRQKLEKVAVEKTFLNNNSFPFFLSLQARTEQ